MQFGFQKPGIFRGDADSMVDDLIAACEKHSAGSCVYSGFGRQLVPWTDDSVPTLAQPLEAKNNR